MDGGMALHRHRPMNYQEFMGSEAARRCYWARSHLGWNRIAAAAPNAGHRAVASLEALGLLTGVVTQNVDGLHQAAGSRSVIDLHGALDRVRCLGCDDVTTRGELDVRLKAANPGLRVSAFESNPDGDAEVSDDALADFRVVGWVPVIIVNQGATRGAPHARLSLDAPLGATLSGA